ncbi:4-carboxy-4-hydroxy-2-oxoadipate aldolase/oxaloacetate decarboxylase [Nocardioides mangrovicus]|uniref:Putative 4-hydroxy-4-methyl-2-oxoglutarate aldolase n=1 Tax=Nocardioides mangrovicus TaxID=2478913 RepID=A0A3L8NZB8_9ACTN|nr:4-carboxy-4-hydroxy-2-oxoadipate aldolase/oxaloacetate decarboxylase [Nocardioides mangrovicus]RLV48530.1 4-carboxy-4-hydroxy-2-oxoadipate aldolase/oxaloacetate decarboxylase [Nocardioides mangrovicus]
MRNVVVTGVPRPSLSDLDALAGFGTATVHEAAGRTGYLGPDLVARVPGARIVGSVVTAVCWPGDNLMIHAAVEQCAEGDVLLVTTTSPCTDGLFGELLATSLRSRGVRGAVLTTGVRDVAELRAMPFPVWSRAVSAQGSVKATAGAVNVPVAVGGVVVHPGDALVADDDGVCVVGRRSLRQVIDASAAREEKEEATRARLREGQLGLDRYELREVLADLGVTYEEAPR